MSRESSEAVTNGHETTIADRRHTAYEREVLAARLAIVERAYADLLARFRGYERERAEIKSRLERILGSVLRLDGHRRA